MKLIVYTDWGSRGNPWPSGCGVYIIDTHGKPLEKRHKYIGEATNNIAEYNAVLLGITRAIELSATEIELRADSKLVIEQLSGRYKIKNPELKKLAWQIGEALQSWWWKIIFTHVYREANKEADRLSNVAMDTKE
jgi:ribonuclease H / adenosylcobalamin/alpha-ribazole phosphatase